MERFVKQALGVGALLVGSMAMLCGCTCWQGGEAVLTGDKKAPAEQSIPRFEQDVRSRIADAQLGGVIGFYRQFEDAETVEAVRRWDAGVRVANIEQFERKNVPGKGWQVVRRGTMTKADETEFKLTTD